MVGRDSEGVASVSISDLIRWRREEGGRGPSLRLWSQTAASSYSREVGRESDGREEAQAKLTSPNQNKPKPRSNSAATE